ncbi:MAG: HD domain-containing protein [Thermodesulfobacteriota bacterium]
MDTKELTQSHILKSAYSISKEMGIPIFLVGGTIRNLLLSSGFEKDFDFAMKGDVQSTARGFADKVKGSFFSLDPQRGHYRVTVKKNSRFIDIDFSRFRGHDIGKDLIKRDFTINSMAINIQDLFEKDEIEIIDPLNGLDDMEKGAIRACSSRVFDDDPLRLLRAVRISAVTNFTIEDKTERLIRQKKELLINSSWERIRDELFLMLDAPYASRSIEKLNSLGLLSIILPETNPWKGINQGEHHDYNLFDHTVKAIEFTEVILANFSEYFPDYASVLKVHFDEELEKNIYRSNLIKFIAFLHDSGKVETKSYDGEKVRFLGHDRVGEEINKNIAKRLKLGHKVRRVITNITGNHMRVLNLSKSTNISQRAKSRFFRDMGKDGIDCLLLSLADGLATRTNADKTQTVPLLAIIQDFLRYYFEDWLKTPEKPLLNGKEIMEMLGILEGKKVGRLLSMIREAEIEGLISTKEEAKDLLKSLNPVK